MKTAEENGLQKSSSGSLRYKDDDVIVSRSRGNASAAQPLRRDTQGVRRNSMENAYNRLVAESDLPEVVHKRGSMKILEEDVEDDMVNTGEDGDGRDDISEGEEQGEDRGEDRDEEAIEGEEEDQDDAQGEEEINEDIEEDGAYVDEERNSGGDGEVTDDFRVCSTNDDVADDESCNDSDDEGHVVYDSKRNSYYDTKSKKTVHLN